MIARGLFVCPSCGARGDAAKPEECSVPKDERRRSKPWNFVTHATKCGKCTEVSPTYLAYRSNGESEEEAKKTWYLNYSQLAAREPKTANPQGGSDKTACEFDIGETQHVSLTVHEPKDNVVNKIITYEDSLLKELRRIYIEAKIALERVPEGPLLFLEAEIEIRAHFPPSLSFGISKAASEDGVSILDTAIIMIELAWEYERRTTSFIGVLISRRERSKYFSICLMRRHVKSAFQDIPEIEIHKLSTQLMRYISPHP